MDESNTLYMHMYAYQARLKDVTEILMRSIHVLGIHYTLQLYVDIYYIIFSTHCTSYAVHGLPETYI